MRTPASLLPLLLPALCGLAACAGDDPDGFNTGPEDDSGSGPTDSGEEEEPLEFDAQAAKVDCTGTSDARMLSDAVGTGGASINDFLITSDEYDYASYAGYLDDNLLLPWYRDVQWAPFTVPCAGDQMAADFDQAMSGDHPVSAAIGEAMDWLGEDRDGQMPLQPGEEVVQTIADDLPGVPQALSDLLQPILYALEIAGDARTYSEAASGDYGPNMVSEGYSLMLYSEVKDPIEILQGESQQWVIGGSGPRSLYNPARVLAYAVEAAVDTLQSDWAGEQVYLDMETEYGRILITNGEGQEWPDRGPVMLWLDLGGDDIYYHPAGASGADVPSGVHIDLGGNDTYFYDFADEGTVSDNGDYILMPADSWGRYPYDGYEMSASEEGRQGAGVFGIGLLFDFGGDDTYMSPRMSQGYAHLGVGVLYDQDGDDLYISEEGAQGTGINGIGMLLDVAGNDVHRAYRFAQGSSALQGLGLAWDGSGDDYWYVNPGSSLDPDAGYDMFDHWAVGIPQNWSQGGASGLDGGETYTYLSGGPGILRDKAGNDDYVAGMFAQGSGYWQSSGWLLDGGGSDEYDGGLVTQGAPYLYSIGLLADAGDDSDAYNKNFEALGLASLGYQMGFGVEFDIGGVVDEGGDDAYTAAAMGEGYGCSVAFMVDNGGDDAYSVSSFGIGDGGCGAETLGLFLDNGGTDTYSGDGSNNDEFGAGASGKDLGVALDGEGETGLHAGETADGTSDTGWSWDDWE